MKYRLVEHKWPGATTWEIFGLLYHGRESIIFYRPSGRNPRYRVPGNAIEAVSRADLSWADNSYRIGPLEEGPFDVPEQPSVEFDRQLTGLLIQPAPVATQ